MNALYENRFVIIYCNGVGPLGLLSQRDWRNREREGRELATVVITGYLYGLYLKPWWHWILLLKTRCSLWCASQTLRLTVVCNIKNSLCNYELTFFQWKLVSKESFAKVCNIILGNVKYFKMLINKSLGYAAFPKVTWLRGFIQRMSSWTTFQWHMRENMRWQGLCLARGMLYMHKATWGKETKVLDHRTRQMVLNFREMQRKGVFQELTLLWKTF